MHKIFYKFSGKKMVVYKGSENARKILLIIIAL